MATRQQLRDSTRKLIGQTDSSNSDFTDSELNQYIDEAQTILAPITESPKDFGEIQVEFDKAAYQLPSDFILLLTLYFGDVNIAKDIKSLEVISEETLKELNRSWLDQTSGTRGRPTRAIVLDGNKTLLIDPRPNADESTTGKKLHFDYVYAPASLGSDGSIPSFSLPYHDLMPVWAAHLCYLGKLKNGQKAMELKQDFYEKIKNIMPTLIKETKAGMRWQWGFDEGFNDDGSWDIIP